MLLEWDLLLEAEPLERESTVYYNLSAFQFPEPLSSTDGNGLTKNTKYAVRIPGEKVNVLTSPDFLNVQCF